jgi:plastocyanin
VKRAHMLVGLALAGCGSGPTVHEVAIRGFRFAPETIRAAVGDTIRWQNHDLFAHTATSAERVWDSGPLSSGAHWQLVLAEPGAHSYLCTLHPNMRGVILSAAR